jgi:hypothetical protein
VLATSSRNASSKLARTSGDGKSASVASLIRGVGGGVTSRDGSGAGGASVRAGSASSMRSSAPASREALPDGGSGAGVATVGAGDSSCPARKSSGVTHGVPSACSRLSSCARRTLRSPTMARSKISPSQVGEVQRARQVAEFGHADPRVMRALTGHESHAHTRLTENARQLIGVLPIEVDEEQAARQGRYRISGARTTCEGISGPWRAKGYHGGYRPVPCSA